MASPHVSKAADAGKTTRSAGPCPYSATRLLSATLLLLSARLAVSGEPVVWQELKGKHFVITFQNDAAFAAEVSRHAEIYYAAILNQLGFRRLDDFWLWERRAKVRIHADRQTFIEQTGAPEWAVAKANFRDRTIEAFGHSDTFLKARLPHEMAHLIFREYIGFQGQVPLWLDEGVAQWCESEALHAPPPARQGWMPLKALTEMDVRTISDFSVVHRFYDQSALLVQYLVEQHGREAFTKFCRQLRDGKTLDEALRFTYPRTVSTMMALERQWTAWVSAYGQRNSERGSGRRINE